MTDQQIDEFLEMLAKSPTSARDMVRGLFAAHEAKAAPAAPKCVVVDRGFRWESEALQHVPRLVIEFEPVPINSPINAKGWMDRDALADMIAASSQEPAAPSQPAVPQGWTDADSDAARLALELECLLLDTETLSVVSKWWASANEALELHRQRLATLAAPSQEPVTLADDDIARCINVATCGRPFIGLMNPGGVPSAFSRSLADLLIAALREKEALR